MINDFTLAHADRKKNDIVYNENNVLGSPIGSKNVFQGFDGKNYYFVSSMSVEDMRRLLLEVSND